MIRTLSTLALSIGSLAALPALAMEVFYWPNPTFLKVPQPEPTPKLIKTESIWKCIGCDPAEDFTLDYIQTNTSITDKYALATLMGNIKQESMFLPNICEGGARVPYHRCYSGGFGLIQWTTESRYNGLGSFCDKYGCDPSTLEGQVRYMINENQFQSNLPYFEGKGKSVDYYMNAAYRWLGWGIHGNRTTYTYQYLNKLTNA